MTLVRRLFSPLDPSMGWKLLSVHEVEAVDVGGNHLSLFEEPHVARLAEALSAILARARSDRSASA